METCEVEQSESEGISSSSDMNGFLSSSCMETDEKGDPFSSDSALGFSVEPTRFDSECIMSSSLTDGGAVQQTICDSVSGEPLTNAPVLSRGLFFDSSSSSGHATTNSVMQSSSSDVVLVSRPEAKVCEETDHTVDLLSPVQLISPVISQPQPHPVVIGNSNAASFVKTVLKSATVLPGTAPTTVLSANTGMPTGLALLNSAHIPQFSLMQPASGLGSSPILIHLPPSAGVTWATGPNNLQPSTVFVNSLSTLSEAGTSTPPSPSCDSTMTNAVSYCSLVPSTVSYQPGTADSLTTHLDTVSTAYVKPVTGDDVLSKQTPICSISDADYKVFPVPNPVMHTETESDPSVHMSSTADCAENETSCDDHDVSVENSGSASSTNGPYPSSSSSNYHSPGHPIVISCTKTEGPGSKGMQQILQHFLQQNSRAIASAAGYSGSEKPLVFSADAHVVPAPAGVDTKSADSSAKDESDSGTESPVTVPVLTSRSSSVVLVLRRQVTQPCGQSQDSKNVVVGSAPTLSAVPSAGSFKVEVDEVDGSLASMQNASLTNDSTSLLHSGQNTSSSSVPSISSEQALVYTSEVGSSLASSTALSDAAADAAGNDSDTQSSIQWMQIQLPDNVADTGKVSRHADTHELQKLIPLTVSEKLSSDHPSPIIICIVQEDGTIKRININTVERHSDVDRNVCEDVVASQTAGQTTCSTDTSLNQEKVTSAGPSSLPETEDIQATDSEGESKTSFDSSVSTVNDSVSEELRATAKQGTNTNPGKDSAASDKKKQYKCDLCTAVFTRPGNFTRHRKIHNLSLKEDRMYKCPYCDRPFLQRCDMNRHIVVHTNEYPFRCKTCDKGYIRRSDLVVHERFHSKVKAFKCDTCGRCFYQSGDLKRHKRFVHSEQSQLPCGHCHRKYASEGTLIRHMKTAHSDVLLQTLKQRTQQQ